MMALNAAEEDEEDTFIRSAKGRLLKSNVNYNNSRPSWLTSRATTRVRTIPPCRWSSARLSIIVLARVPDVGVLAGHRRNLRRIGLLFERSPDNDAHTHEGGKQPKPEATKECDPARFAHPTG